MDGASNSNDNISITNLDTLKEYLREQDNSEDALYFSSVPQKCKNFPCVLGIDKAVLCPMVYGTAFCAVNDMAELLTLDCVDSKALTEEVRDKLFEKICNSSKLLSWDVEVISPNKICNSMFSRTKHSLNQVSMDSAIGLIRSAIKAGVNIEYIYIDTVGPPEKNQAYLLSLFPSYKITVAKKADSTYPIVSAASICAKVIRDHALSAWEFQKDIEACNDGTCLPKHLKCDYDLDCRDGSDERNCPVHNYTEG